MTEKIRRVAVDGPPDPDEHPWVAAHNPNFSEHFVVQPNDAAAADWSDSAEWYPVPAPPTEYMTVEWVTDRLPNDDELPAVYVWIDPPGMFDDYGVWTVPEDYKIEEPCPQLRWRSLLDAAGLGER